MHICLYVPYTHKNPQSLSHPSRPAVQAQYLPCPPPKALPSAPAPPARPGWPFDLQPAAAPASVGGGMLALTLPSGNIAMENG